MHVVFLSHYFPPEVNAPATRTLEHCRTWARAGHRVTVVTCAPNCPAGVVFNGYRNAWRTEEMVEGVRVIRVWTWIAPNAGFLPRIVNYLSYLVTALWQALWLRNVDVVVATSPQFFCGWAGVLCRWIRRWPFVLEIRDIWPESIVAVGAMRKSRAIRLLEWMEGRMYRAADHIVTVGEGYRQQLLAKGVPEAKLSVIPNGVDVGAWTPRAPSPELRQRWNGEGRFVVAYVGTVGMAHGLDVVLDAARRRPDVTFWIVGDGAEKEPLRIRAAERGIDNVVFTGLVSKDLVADVLATCDACLVHLRGTELFGTVIPSKIFETMAMNVPIVMGVKGQAREIVLSAGAGVPMIPDDAESLVEAIEAVRRDAARFRGGREFVSRHYDRGALAARMLERIALSAGGGEMEGDSTSEVRRAA